MKGRRTVRPASAGDIEAAGNASTGGIAPEFRAVVAVVVGVAAACSQSTHWKQVSHVDWGAFCLPDVTAGGASEPMAHCLWLEVHPRRGERAVWRQRHPPAFAGPVRQVLEVVARDFGFVEPS